MCGGHGAVLFGSFSAYHIGEAFCNNDTTVKQIVGLDYARRLFFFQ
jgi:hypothetical protein